MTPLRYLRNRCLACRRAATIVESAVILAVLLVLLLGMLELSIALVRHTVLAEAARRVARAAIVHGAKANSAQGQWGIASVNTTAAGTHEAAGVARVVLMTIDPADISINIVWPDGGNEPDQRVQVTLSYTHYPLLPIPSWYSQLHLQGVSTMRIAH